ncbi:MAG: S8 family serine peptidase [candidate division Zixibacteria bacterium]|nr:S8 family serine peptidase [candidate division Zixibacteria bacterium]
MLKSNVVSLLLVLLVVSMAWSGEISPYLADHLQDMTASSEVDVVVMMSDQVDIVSLKRQLKQDNATLAERNRIVIEALQEKANLTQQSAATYLDDLQSQGLIKRYKKVWIANMFIVTANKAGIEAIASLSEFSDLYYNYIIEGITPVEIGKSDPPLTTSIEIGLARINAPAAWAAGFTGAGRVVANMDTGVDGNHPAFSDRFRGDVDNDGDVDESWFDPYAGWTFPQDSGSHGTHTMGTICGCSPNGDTIGVAIEAQWISAAPIDRGGGIPGTIADAILSFQWFVDPDGNPETQDNPDAVGNSWGISPIYHGVPACDETFWVVIDNLEAAGTAVVFSAGNEGNQADAVRTPADRATTEYNCFSVGSVNGNLPHLPISSFSSCGPVYCTPDGSMACKPEVVAPGDNIRSSVPGGGYTTMSGTSMASPHITGAIGVIRSANPDLDVDSIKEILLATAYDLGDAGDDNTYGYGIIDLYEACLVAQQGYGFVEGYVYDEESNLLDGALIEVDGSTRLSYTDENGFYHIGLPADTTYTLIASFFGHYTDTAAVTITADQTVNQDFYLDYADYGFLHGYVYDSDSIALENAVLSVNDTPLDVVYTNSDGYYYFDNIPCGATYNIEAAASGHGCGLASVYIPENDTASQDFYLQMLESFEYDNGGYVGSGCWQWGSPGAGPDSAYDGSNVWGTTLNGDYPNNVDDWLTTIIYEVGDQASYSFYHWFDIENSWDGGNIQITTNGGSTWNVITPEGGYPDNSVVGLDYEPGFTNSSGGWQPCVVDLSSYAGQTIQLAFRFGTDGSVNRDGWFIDAVVLNPGINTGISDENIVIPSIFSLAQNYPNPFNPTTEISFNLPVSGYTTLEIYDIIGRRVKTLVSEELNAGTHTVTWNSSDNSDNSVASGVYFYKLKQADDVVTKKMMMLK